MGTCPGVEILAFRKIEVYGNLSYCLHHRLADASREDASRTALFSACMTMAEDSISLCIRRWSVS